LYLSNLLQLVLEFIFNCLPSTMQQCQDLELNRFKIRHCTTCFGPVGHDQVLCLPSYCDLCFRVHSVSNWSQYSSSFYATIIVPFGMPVAYLVCGVDELHAFI
jgi:hypothetical protein